jgi:glycosyltransferase involved in cell wall biosynthesis
MVIPCYNEANSIPIILEKFAGLITDENIEVILVDNGSTDDSAAVLERLLPQYRFAKTVKVEINQGYGYGILTGLKAAGGRYVGWTHADLQTDPKDAITAFGLISENTFVKGRRQGRPLFDRFFTFGMGVFESILLGRGMWDINAQPTIFPKGFFEVWQNPPHDFSLDLYAYYLAVKSGLKLKRFPVVFPPRQFGVSHWNTGIAAKWKFIKRTFGFSLELKKRGIR